MLRHIAILLLLCAVAAPSAQAHCQIPCGIYSDMRQFDELLEHCQTLEKSANMILELSSSEGNVNQVVRWVMNKESHAKKFQQTLLDYFLAQRIKAPKKGDAAAKARYLKNLTLVHQMIVRAMKCKQTTDPDNASILRELLLRFKHSYFGNKGNKHIKLHHTKKKEGADDKKGGK